MLFQDSFRPGLHDAILTALHAMGREPRNRQAFVRAGLKKWLPYLVIIMVGVSLLVVLAALHLVSRGPSELWRNESNAIASMEALATLQFMYFATYPEKGFASTLAELGPPPEGSEPSEEAADLIAARLASGEKAGYRFTLQAGSPDAEGIVNSFSCSARPSAYNRTGKRSFFINDSYNLHATDEDRPATIEDPPIE